MPSLVPFVTAGKTVSDELDKFREQQRRDADTAFGQQIATSQLVNETARVTLQQEQDKRSILDKKEEIERSNAALGFAQKIATSQLANETTRVTNQTALTKLKQEQEERAIQEEKQKNETIGRRRRPYCVI